MNWTPEMMVGEVLLRGSQAPAKDLGRARLPRRVHLRHPRPDADDDRLAKLQQRRGRGPHPLELPSPARLAGLEGLP